MLFSTRQFQKQVIDTTHVILGGVKIFFIQNSRGKLIFKEELQSSKTMRPYWLIQGKEEDKAEIFCPQIGENMNHFLVSFF